MNINTLKKHNRASLVGIIILTFTVAITSYWWIFYTPRYDLQMAIVGFQGDVLINGEKLNGDTQTFNANQATIKVLGGGTFNGKLEDGSYIQITENSQLTIAKAKRNKDSYRVRTSFKLDTGQIIRDIPKVARIGDYSSSLITTSVNIGVRGTRYVAIANKQVTRTMVYQGSIGLDSKGLDELILKQNYGTITEAGKPSEKPSILPPPPTSLLSESGERINTREWNIQWNPVAEAQAYLVEVAEDDEFRNVIYRKQADSNQLSINDLPYDANFRWRVSSIDNRELRGIGSQVGRIHYKYHHKTIQIYNGSPEDAAVLINKALRGYAADTMLLKDIGKYFYRIKQYEHAIMYFSKAIVIEPENAELLLERGRAFQAIGKHTEAQEDFNNTLAIKTDSPEAYWSLGTVKSEQGHLENSIEYFYRAIAAEPDHSKAHLSAANAWIKMGAPKKARQHIMLHMENFPDDQAAQQMLDSLP